MATDQLGWTSTPVCWDSSHRTSQIGETSTIYYSETQSKNQASAEGGAHMSPRGPDG